MTAPLELRGLTGDLAALRWGDPSATPVLALHGWLDNAASFSPLSRYLEGYQLVAMDFAGHGFSQHRPPGAIYHFLDHVADVAHAVRSLGWTRLTLVGHSLGANVAVVFSAAYPDLVERLVLIDGVGPTSGSADDSVARLRKSIDAGLDPATPRRTGYPDWATLISARCQASPISSAAAELLVRRNAYEQDGEIRLRSDRRLRQPSPVYLVEEAVMTFLEGVSAATLVILAAEGVVQSRPVTHQRIAAMANARKVTLPGRHHLHMDSPDVVAGAMLPFLRGDP